MKWLLLSTVLSLPIALISSPAVVNAQGRDGGPTGALTFSSDAATAAVQREVKDVVERYQTALNAGDFETMRTLFAPNAVAEWNEKRTMVGTDAMAPEYEALFAKTQFSTDFQFDAVDLIGDVAIVRTHHPAGQTEVSKQTGNKTLDLNREIFVLRRTAGEWRIILYTFNAQPRQGEQ